MEAADFEAVLDTVRAFVRKEVVPAEELIEETDEIPETIRAKAAEMGLFGFALPEAEAGSDPSGIRTRATRTGDGYVLSGQKRFITNADRAGVFMVFARSGADSVGTKGISVFAVDADRPGVRVGPSDAKMGQRGAHAAESRQGGQPIAGFQQVQAMLADSQTEAYAGRAMVLAAAAEYDDGTDRRMAPSAAKLFCSEMVGRVADRAVQIHGGLGYLRTVAVERFYRDVRLFRIYEGTSEVQRVIVAKQLLADARK